MVAEDCSEYDRHPDNILVHKLCYSTLTENFTKFDRNEIYRIRPLLQNLKVIFLQFALIISDGARNLFLGGSYINLCVCEM